ncbi:MAG TPA: hypothetical protein VF666_10405 [Pyrinomonadaceae bacterium]|jgi:hypothetical protein
MMKEAMIAIGTTAREFLRNWRTMLVFNLLYALLLASFYLFVSTREATVWQLVVTALAALAVPVLFFMIQAAGVSYSWTDATEGSGTLLRRSVRNFWKLLLVSIPLILLGVGVVYLLNKLQARFPLPDPPPDAMSRSMAASGTPSARLSWETVLFPSLRLLFLALLLPLAAIHLWISIARNGFVGTLKKLHRVVACAFVPSSLFVYTVGLVAFAFIPYLLIFKRTTVEGAWLELIIFGLRLALAFVFTLWGWIITLGALSKLAAATTETHVHEATAHEAAPLGETASVQ